MAQYARPNSDVSVGSPAWTPSTGTTLYECIDETSASDTDYIVATAGDGPAIIGLSTVTDPVSSTGHTFRMRARSTGSGGPEKLDVDLYQSTTLIANMLVNQAISRDTFGDLSYSLTGGEIDSITDYSALRVHLSIDTLGGGETIEVSWMELEVPDVTVAGTNKTLLLLGVG